MNNSIQNSASSNLGATGKPHFEKKVAAEALPVNKRPTEHNLIHYPHHHIPSVTEKKLRKSTAWANFSVPILEMHDTIAIPGDPYTMSPNQLDEEMSWLKSHGFHTVTLDDVYNAIYRGRSLPSRSIVLTFDDGYESNFTTATPILQKFGFVATEFVVGGFVNRSGFLTLSELQQMSASHVWEIEAHTMTHPYLTRLDKTELANQVNQVKAVVSRITGEPVNYFAYPYGAYNGKVLRAIKQAGYTLAVCTEQGYANPSTDGPLLLNRIAIHQGLPIATYAKLLSKSL